MATGTPSRRCSTRSRPATPRSCGAWATWSATAPSPMRASNSPASTPPCAWPATTTSPSRARSPLGEFSRGASLAAQWTQEVIAPEHRDFLAGLRPQGQEGPIGLYHASPRDPVWEYVLSALLAELCLDGQPSRVCLIGHSHVALSFVRHEGELASGEPRREGVQLDISERRMAAKPRQRGSAARRRPACLLADARSRRSDRLVQAHRLRCRRCGCRDSLGAPARLARRAAGVRSVSMPRPTPHPLALGRATGVSRAP